MGERSLIWEYRLPQRRQGIHDCAYLTMNRWLCTHCTSVSNVAKRLFQQLEQCSTSLKKVENNIEPCPSFKEISLKFRACS